MSHDRKAHLFITNKILILVLTSFLFLPFLVRNTTELFHIIKINAPPQYMSLYISLFCVNLGLFVNSISPMHPST